MANFQQSLRPPHPSCFCPPLPPPSDLDFVQVVNVIRKPVLPRNPRQGPHGRDSINCAGGADLLTETCGVAPLRQREMAWSYMHPSSNERCPGLINKLLKCSNEVVDTSYSPTQFVSRRGNLIQTNALSAIDLRLPTVTPTVAVVAWFSTASRA